MKEVRIEPVLNGWIVRIGCATIVALSKEVMLSEIGRYIDDPKAVEREYSANAVNKGTYQPDERPGLPPPESIPDAGEDQPERARREPPSGSEIPLNG